MESLKYFRCIGGIVGENPEKARKMIDLREKIKAHARTLEALENTEKPSNNGYKIMAVAIGKNGDLIALGGGIMTYAVGVGLKTFEDDEGKTQFFWDYGKYYFEYNEAYKVFKTYIDCSEGLDKRLVWTNN